MCLWEGGTNGQHGAHRGVHAEVEAAELSWVDKPTETARVGEQDATFGHGWMRCGISMCNGLTTRGPDELIEAKASQACAFAENI